MSDAQVNWYEQDVKLAVENATDEFLTELAFYVEGEAKTGAPVDTGFMRNAIYAIGPLTSHRARAVVEAKSAANRDLASEARVGENEAAVHGAAEYTIYQEMKVGFLYRALEKAQSVAGGIIQATGKKHL
jgi:hypothetical protein